MHPIDHLVLPVTTLMLARSRLAGLGFTVAPDARHPFGTGNCCVFFENRTYLEPITILDRAAADMAAAEGVFFVRRVKRFTERQGEGFAMLAFRSDDADADRAAFEAAGIASGPVYRFVRNAILPDGSAQEIGVALAYVDHPGAPDATFFACQHLASEVLYQPAYLEHPNGALGVACVAAVAEDPAEFRDLLAAAARTSDVSAGEAGLQADIGEQSVLVLTPAGFRARYGLEPPDPRRGLLLAAFELTVADLDRAIGHAGPLAMRHEERIVVPPSSGLGAVLAFRARTDG